MNIRKCQSSADLTAVYPIMRELRPKLSFEDYSYLTQMAQERDEYEIIAAFEEEECVAAMGLRILFDFVHGKHLYIDDLVVTQKYRSQGTGAKLLEYAETLAKENNCKGLRLCTGVEQKDAQRFYEKNKWVARALAYKKTC